jgi:hypothetical protein
MSRTTRLTLTAAVVLATAWTAQPALAAPCPPDRQPSVFVKDVISSDEVLLETLRSSLPPLRTLDVALTGDIDNVNLQPPAGSTFRRDGTRALRIVPKAAGPLAIAATWTAPEGNGTCEGAMTITLPIGSLDRKPRVRFKRFNAIDRPLVEFTVLVDRGPFADGSPVTVRARVGTRAAPPGGRPPALFTLGLAPPEVLSGDPPRSGYLSRRSARRLGFVIRGLSAFDADNSEQVDVPLRGTAAQIKFGLDGSRFARRGLVLEIVQRGRVLGRLSTGILCSRARCRLPGYRTRS